MSDLLTAKRGEGEAINNPKFQFRVNYESLSSYTRFESPGFVPCFDRAGGIRGSIAENKIWRVVTRELVFPIDSSQSI